MFVWLVPSQAVRQANTFFDGVLPPFSNVGNMERGNSTPPLPLFPSLETPDPLLDWRVGWSVPIFFGVAFEPRKG